MKITDSRIPNVTVPISPKDDDKTAQQSKTAVPVTSEDQASVGSVASAVSKITEAQDAKVEHLRAQHLQGVYKIDAQKLSAKLIDEHLKK